MSADSPATATQRPLILASTSRYRAELLSRLHLEFTQLAPDCDETPLVGESPAELVVRLAEAKARSLLGQPSSSDAVIIGSDQVADLDGEILGKPGDTANATRQLTQMSAQSVVFRTGLCVLDGATGASNTEIVNVTAVFRKLDLAEIERYLSAEKPFDCAASFRSEGLGIALLESLQSDDPSAVIGLPLLRLAVLLRDHRFLLP